MLSGAVCRDELGDILRRLSRGIVRTDGLAISVRSPRVNGRTVVGIRLGIYERAERQFVKQYVPDSLDVIELGASIGVVSGEIARKLRPGTTFVAVEADIDLTPLLRENIQGNRTACRAIVEPCAVVSPKHEGPSVAFWRNCSTSTGGQLAKGREGDNVVAVPALSLSGLCRKHGLGTFALVTDIEGTEAAVIFDDAAALARCSVIIAELHDTVHEWRKVNVAAMQDRLQSLGFVLADSYANVFVYMRRGSSEAGPAS